MRAPLKAAVGLAALSTFPALWTAYGLGPQTSQFLPIALLSASLCFCVQWASRALSPLLCPASYPKLSEDDKAGWDTRVPALLHALLASAAVPLLLLGEAGDALRAQDLVWGSHHQVATLLAISAGYFVWDTYVSVRMVEHNGVAFVVHGVLCLFVYVNGFRPFLQYYSAVFLFFEVSTPSLNMWWFLQKTGHGGSLAQRACGVTTLATFLFVRLGYGIYHSVPLWRLTTDEWGECHNRARCGDGGYYKLVVSVVLAANVALTLLNAFWFYRGVRGALKKPRARKGE